MILISKMMILKSIVGMILILALLSTFTQAKSAYLLSVSYGDPIEEHYKELLAENLYWILNYNGYNAHNYHNMTERRTVFYAAGAEDEPEFSITLYIGHGYYDDHMDPGFRHYYLMVKNGDVYDYQIYDCTSNQKNHLIYMWSCYQGQVVGGYSYTYHRAYGQPYSWTRHYLGYYGYWLPDGSTYVFIGFKQNAPFLKEIIDGVNAAGYQFTFYFIAYATAWYEHYSIKEALDLATNAVWHNIYFWDESPLYDRGMWVYGDSSLRLNSLG